jgi:hypothetical protein
MDWFNPIASLMGPRRSMGRITRMLSVPQKNKPISKNVAAAIKTIRRRMIWVANAVEVGRLTMTSHLMSDTGA